MRRLSQAYSRRTAAAPAAAAPEEDAPATAGEATPMDMEEAPTAQTVPPNDLIDIDAELAACEAELPGGSGDPFYEIDPEEEADPYNLGC